MWPLCIPNGCYRLVLPPELALLLNGVQNLIQPLQFRLNSFQLEAAIGLELYYILNPLRGGTQSSMLVGEFNDLVLGVGTGRSRRPTSRPSQRRNPNAWHPATATSNELVAALFTHGRSRSHNGTTGGALFPTATQHHVSKRLFRHDSTPPTTDGKGKTATTPPNMRCSLEHSM